LWKDEESHPTTGAVPGMIRDTCHR
jgi:hypothetical protein